MSRRRWSEEDGEFTLGGAREGLRSKPRFSFTELRVLLDAVKKNRYILLKKFNQGVPAEDKKRTWTDITNQVNCLGENHRQVRQIMKKWADLKCDGKRRIAAMRGPNGSSVRKKGLGPVEKMVHKILKLSPNRDVDSDSDLEGAELYKRYGRGPAPYLSLTDSPPGGAAFDISPLSSPEKDIGDQLQSSSEVDLAEDGELGLDFEENEDSTFSSLSSSLAPASYSSTTPAEPPLPLPLPLLPDSSLPRSRPVHTYSRTAHNPVSDRPPPGPSLSSSSLSSSSGLPPAPPPGLAPPPPGQADLAQVAQQSLEQQRAGRALLGSVAGSLEALAGSARLLVEGQRAFLQEALLLQREALAVLTDFSHATLGLLRDKATNATNANATNANATNANATNANASTPR